MNAVFKFRLAGFLAAGLLVLAAHQASGDLTVTGFNVWTSSLSSIGDDAVSDLDTSNLESGTVQSQSVTQFGNWPGPGSAQATASAQLDLTVVRSAILVNGWTLSENLQFGGPTEIYSEAVAHLDFQFQVVAPTVLDEFSFQGNSWSFVELLNLDTQSSVNQGTGITLNPGNYSFTAEQFEFMQGAHGDPQNAEPFTLILVDSGTISVVPEPAIPGVLLAGLLLMLVATRTRADCRPVVAGVAQDPGRIY